MCWGKNNRGQLGNGTQDAVAHATPTAVTSIPSTFSVESIDIGALHMCATSAVGDTWCWGAYTNGRLGTTAASDSLTPQRISTLAAGVATSATAGFNHSCVVLNAAGWCFGSNSSGQLGSDPNTYTQSSTPLSVAFTSAPDMIASGKDVTCAVLISQTLECFGLNDNGQLGESLVTASRYTPQTVGGITTGVVDIALGGTHACAVFASGAVKCWGAGSQGQLGNGGTTRQTSAVAVGSLNIAPTTTTTSSSSTTSTSSTPSSTSTSSSSTTVLSTSPSGQQGVTSTPKFIALKRNRYITARALAKHVALTIPKTSQGTMRFTIVRGSKYCAFVGTKVKGIRKGTCSVLVTLIPKRGVRTLRTAKVVVS
jgi:alpha-tubulin suppressor-like RCC1 family protein